MDLIKNIGYIICVLLVLTRPALLAQAQEHDHTHHQHVHPKNEIGVGNYLSYLVGERELAYAFHVHYLRSIEQSRFSAGIGYEQIFDEHKHRSLAFIGAFNPASSLILSLSPGILLGTKEEPGKRFALHTEAVYEFEISHFHIGPALEFATTFDEYHISLGLHFAFVFQQ